MSDPLRTDTSRALEAASDADRDAKIEQLLLVGLDHYFAAQYEQAVNVWTRALFLDRAHPRARAYIERARSALAERQRQSEELLQSGVAAFHRGESGEARRLIQAALEGGAPADEAFAVLDRLNRLDAAPEPEPSRRAVRRPRAALPLVRAVAPSSRGGLALAITALLVVVVAGAFAAASWDRLDWRAWLPLEDAPPSAVLPLPRDAAPPLPRRGELALTRARALAAGGHLHDALKALDAVRQTDPQKPDADRLRGDIQRQLLGLAAVGAQPPAGETGDGRQP